MASLDEKLGAIALFNSRLETGVRAVVVLDAVYPKAFDLTHMTWFDHLVVHTRDVDGPESLHPDLPHRAGELLVRRRLIEEGLTMMRRVHLVDPVVEAGGIAYRASDEAPAFVHLLRSKYSRTLRERASWLADHVCSLDEGQIQKLIYDRIGRWNVEFEGEKGGVSR